MTVTDVSQALRHLFSELTTGVAEGGGGYILNSGDAGLLRSLDDLSAAEASQTSVGAATTAAHAQHLRYGLSLMNRWATMGGNPFADARWDDAWALSAASEPQWDEIRQGLRAEATQWAATLGTPRAVNAIELTGMIASVVHLAYHLGAIRQIAQRARGPRGGTFV